MENISSIAEQYLRVSRGEIKADPEFLRRNLLEKFTHFSNAEKMEMYRKNVGPDNPYLSLVKDCGTDDEAWEKIEYVEQVFLRSMRDVLVERVNNRHEGEKAGDIHRRTQIALIVKTVLPLDKLLELAPAVS